MAMHASLSSQHCRLIPEKREDERDTNSASVEDLDTTFWRLELQESSANDAGPSRASTYPLAE